MRRCVQALVVAILLFLVTPVLVVIPMAFSSSAFLEFPPPGWTTEWFAEFFRDPDWIDALTLSLRVAGGAMVLSLTVGTAAAYALVRRGVRFRGATQGFLTLPIVMPTIVYAVGAYLVALKLGLVGSELLLMCAHAVLALPFVLLNVTASLQTIDQRLELVAQSMGARPWTAFRSVTLPLIAPALIASALIAVVISLDETVVALFLTEDTRPTLPVKVYNSIRYDLNAVVPAAAAVVLAGTVAIAAALGLVRWVIARATGMRAGAPAGDGVEIGAGEPETGGAR
ncbi:ABC transporter permease [Conexibacter arvalis]|nr:ABC transporter permease [Conexibacter arvalis]